MVKIHDVKFVKCQGGHGTGKTGNLVLTFADRQNTGNFVLTQGKIC